MSKEQLTEATDEELMVAVEDETAAAGHTAPRSVRPAPNGGSAADAAKLAELDSALAKFQTQQRWVDVARTLKAKADLIHDGYDRATVLAEAAAVYGQRLSNHTEALKCYEAVLELDPSNSDAVAALKDLYEKRRDWEKLIRIMRTEAQNADLGERAERAVELARLAMERVRKPEVCVELWEDVRSHDPENAEALSQLSALYERSRDWEKLASVLEMLVGNTNDPAERAKQLLKLGMLYADKTKDDQGAVRAFEQLLELDPGDRRAQEQLRRRYVTLKDWDALESLFSRTNNWEELVRALERAATETTDKAEKTEILFRVATLWEERIGKPERATRAYEQVLEGEPGNPRAVAALLPIYEKARQFSKMAALYEAKLANLEDPTEKVELLEHMADFFRERLRDTKRAYECYEQAFRVQPDRADVRDKFIAAAEAAKRQDDVIRLHRELIDQQSDPIVLVSLRLGLGQALESSGKIEEAIAEYRQVLELTDDHPDALSALERLYRRANQFEQLLDVLQLKHVSETDPEQQKAILFAIAEVLEKNVGDQTRAIETYQRILDESGETEIAALEGMERLHAAREDWSALADVLHRMAGALEQGTTEWVRAAARLAQILRDHLQQREEAVQIYQQLLELPEARGEACRELETLLEDADVGVGAAQALVEAYRTDDRPRELARSLDALARGMGETPESLDVLYELADLQLHRLQQREEGYRTMLRALAVRPEDEQLIAQVSALADELGHETEFYTQLENVAAQTKDTEIALSLLQRAANAYQALGDRGSAIRVYQAQLKHTPEDEGVLLQLEQLYRATERWAEVLDVLRRRSELGGDVEQKIALTFEMAEIQAAKLEDETEAIGSYKRILELDPEHREVLRALDRIFESKEMWADLADNLERQLAVVEHDAERRQLTLRLASLRESQMYMPDAAIEMYRELVEQNPGDAEARQALERYLRQPEYQSRVVGTLEEAYRQVGEQQALAALYQVLVETSEVAEERLQNLKRLAEVCEYGLEDAERAFAVYQQAFAVDPSDADVQRELERLADGLNAWDALATRLVAMAAEAGVDPRLGLKLRIQAASVYESRLDEKARAIALYREALSVDPADATAVDALIRLYQESGQYPELAQMLCAKGEIVEDLEEKRTILTQAARIYEEAVGDAEQAIRVYRINLERFPEDDETLGGLARLYVQLERWKEYLEVTRTREGLVSDLDEKAQLLRELGGIYEEKLGELDPAIESFERAAELTQLDLGLVDRLSSLYERTERWDDLRAVLERGLDVAQDPGEILGLRLRLGHVWRDRFADDAQAVEAYKSILEIEPGHADAVAALQGMIAANRSVGLAADVLAPIYRDSGDWESLVRVLHARAAAEEDTSERVRVLDEIGSVYEDALGDIERAFAASLEALKTAPADPGVREALERRAGLLGQWERAVSAYESAAADAADDTALRVDLLLRVATILEDAITDAPRAIGTYRSIVEADPAQIEAHDALIRLYERTGDWQAQAAALQGRIERETQDENIVRLRLRLGEVLRSKLGQPEQAVAQYAGALEVAPDNGEILTMLENMLAAGECVPQAVSVLEHFYREHADWERLVRMYDQALVFLTEPTAWRETAYKLASVLEETLGDAQRAFECYAAMVRRQPSEERAIEEAERLGRLLGEWDALANAYVDALEQELPPETQVLIGQHLARLYETELNDIERAEATYRYVHEINPANEDALEALDRIYSMHNAAQELSTILRKRIDVTQDVETKVTLHYRLGQVLANELGNLDEAVIVYRKVLDELDPGHLDTIRALQNAYLIKDDIPSLLDTLSKELAVTHDERARSETLARMARLASDQLGDLPRAIELWKSALELRGDDAEIFEALAGLYLRLEDWANLVEVLERQAEIADDTSTKIRIYSELARAWAEKLQRYKNAEENWRRVLDLDPENVDALFALAEVLRVAQDFEELVSTLHRIIEFGAATLEDRVLEDVYLQLATVYADNLARPGDAVDAYQRALEINPRNMAALDGLERIYAAEENWDACVSVRERRVDAFEDPQDQLRELNAVAQLAAEKLGDLHRQQVAYERILQIEPRHPEAFQSLMKVHSEGGNWDSVIDLTLRYAEGETDALARAGQLRRVAQIYEEQLEQFDQAFEVLQVAWAENYADEQIAHDLERLAGRTQKWNELLTSANEALKHVQDPAFKIAICLRCARWYGVELGHPEYAIPYYQEILTLDPANVAAIRQMVELYWVTEQWPTVAQTLARLAEVTDDPAERMYAYARLGEVCESKLGTPEQATYYVDQALEIDAAHPEALELLEEHLARHGRSEELAKLLDRAVAAAADDDARVDLLLRLGNVHATGTQNLPAAIAAYEKVLERDGNMLTALRALEQLYTDTGHWQELLRVLEKEAELAEADKERAELLMRIGNLWEEQFVKPERAVEHWEQVATLDPYHQDVYAALERGYRTLQRWNDVVDTLQRAIAQCTERLRKIELLCRLADVYSHELKDFDRAASYLAEASELDPDNVEVLFALAALYEKEQSYDRALDVLQRIAELPLEGDVRVDVHCRMGSILEKRLRDTAGAIEKYRSALEINPLSLDALRALRELYANSGEWVAVSRVMEREIEAHQRETDKAKAWVALGEVWDKQLKDHRRAIECYENAIELDRNCIGAAGPLAEEYLAGQRWQDAFPLLQVLAEASAAWDAQAKLALWYQYGQCALELGLNDEALRGFTQAHNLDPAHLPALIGLAGARFGRREWDEAFKHYQMLLVHHRDRLSTEQSTEVFFRLGCIKLEQNERRKAINMFDKALEESPHHRPTLDMLIKLYEESGEHRQVAQFKRRVLETESDSEKRFALLQELARLCQEQLRDPKAAIEYYREASDMRPNDHALLHQLLALYQETRRWQDAVDVITRIADVDDRPVAKGKYAYTAGVIYRDELKDRARALESFERALDMDSTQLKSFEAINRIHTEDKNWKELERAFRRMAHRIVGKGDVDLEHSIWHGLGLIYRDRLNQPQAALEAFKMAASLKPDNLEERQILAEIYEIASDNRMDAAQEHMAILRSDPQRVQSYQALYRLFFEAGQFDRAWCVASVLSYLKYADQEQQHFYDQYKTGGPIRPYTRLDNERWFKDLMHPDEDRFVGRIFEITTRAWLQLKQVTDKEYGLQKKFLHDPNSSTVTFAKTFGFAAQVLNIPTPRLFLRPDVQGGLLYAITEPPASVSGGSLLSGFSPQDLAFIIGKHLSYYRGEHYLRWVLPSAAELKGALVVAVELVGMGPGDASLAPVVKQLRSKMQPVELEALKAVVKKFVDSGARTDIKQWMRAVEFTACRAGFLLVHDFQVAQRILQSEPASGAADIPAKEKLGELLVFSVSEEYSKLRRALGIEVKVA